MKILHVSAAMDYKKGGVAQAIRSIIKSTEQYGISNEVLSVDSPHNYFAHKDDFIIHCKGPGVSPWNYSQLLLPWLKANFLRFDCIIIHGLWSYHGFAVKRALQFHKKNHQAKNPLVFIMPHGMLDPYFQIAPGRRLKAFRNWLYWKLIESRVVNNADKILFTSETERALASVPFKPYTQKKEKVIGLGIEAPPSFTNEMNVAFNERCPALKNTAYLLFIGRIDQKKGIDLLLLAYLKCLKKNGNKPLKLLIAGPGLESSFGKYVVSIYKDNPEFEGQVYFTGMLTGNEKWGAFYSCDAFILPSHQENFGIAVVESLACGKPVLITEQVNIWKEIQNSMGGLIEKDTVDGIEQLLDKWRMLGEIEKQKFREGALLAFQKNFTISTVSERLLGALKN